MASDHTGTTGAVNYLNYAAVNTGATGQGYFGSLASPTRPSVTGGAEMVQEVLFGRGAVVRGMFRGAYGPVLRIDGLAVGGSISDVIGPGSELIVFKAGAGGYGGLYIETAKEW